MTEQNQNKEMFDAFHKDLSNKNRILILNEMIEEVKKIVFDDNVKAYSLGKKYDISETQMKKYKNGSNDIDNMKLSTFKKFFKD